MGSLYFIPKNSKIDSSVGKSISTASPFFPAVILNNPCSFNVKPTSNALCLITILNAFEPVKYNVAKEYSFGAVYRKSNRLGIEPDISPIVRLLVLPLVNNSVTTFSLISLSKKSLKALILF